MEILDFCSDLITKLSSDISQDEKSNILVDIKKNFYERKYLNVFLSSMDHLMVYFEHYVPSRVLCYASIFRQKELLNVLSGRSRTCRKEIEKRRMQRRNVDTSMIFEKSTNHINILCIGSGPGSELISLFHILSSEFRKHSIRADQISRTLLYSEFEDSISGMQVDNVNIHNIDIADYSFLHDTIWNELKGNSHRNICSKFTMCDILSNTDLFADQELITFMFVLNELFSISKQKTVLMLTDLLNKMENGAFILFVESAGSFSELSVGSKEFKVYQVLDGIKRFKLVYANDARWYRYSDEKGISEKDEKIKLNNMRYFIRLYQKVKFVREYIYDINLSSSSMPQYDPLRDKSLQSYFQRPVVKKHLMKIGLFDHDGNPIPDRDFKHKLIVAEKHDKLLAEAKLQEERDRRNEIGRQLRKSQLQGKDISKSTEKTYESIYSRRVKKTNGKEQSAASAVVNRPQTANEKRQSKHQSASRPKSAIASDKKLDRKPSWSISSSTVSHTNSNVASPSSPLSPTPENHLQPSSPTGNVSIHDLKQIMINASSQELHEKDDGSEILGSLPVTPVSETPAPRPLSPIAESPITTQAIFNSPTPKSPKKKSSLANLRIETSSSKSILPQTTPTATSSSPQLIQVKSIESETVAITNSTKNVTIEKDGDKPATMDFFSASKGSDPMIYEKKEGFAEIKSPVKSVHLVEVASVPSELKPTETSKSSASMENLRKKVSFTNLNKKEGEEDSNYVYDTNATPSTSSTRQLPEAQTEKSLSRGIMKGSRFGFFGSKEITANK